MTFFDPQWQHDHEPSRDRPHMMDGTWRTWCAYENNETAHGPAPRPYLIMYSVLGSWEWCWGDCRDWITGGTICNLGHRPVAVGFTTNIPFVLHQIWPTMKRFVNPFLRQSQNTNFISEFEVTQLKLAPILQYLTPQYPDTENPDWSERALV